REGCTWVTSQIRELSYIHSRDVTFAVFAEGPHEESAGYRAFMGWEVPRYSAPRDSLDILPVGRKVGMMHIVCCLRQGEGVRDDDGARRRRDGQQLPFARFDRLRAVGDVGGLAGRLATTAQRQASNP